MNIIRLLLNAVLISRLTINFSGCAKKRTLGMPGGEDAISALQDKTKLNDNEDKTQKNTKTAPAKEGHIKKITSIILTTLFYTIELIAAYKLKEAYLRANSVNAERVTRYLYDASLPVFSAVGTFY